MRIFESMAIAGKACDASCYNAKYDKCDCICLGVNHGKGLASAQAYMASLTAEELASKELAICPEKAPKGTRKTAKRVTDTVTNITYDSLYQCGKELAHLISPDQSRFDTRNWYRLVRKFPDRFTVLVDPATVPTTDPKTAPTTGSNTDPNTA